MRLEAFDRVAVFSTSGGFRLDQRNTPLAGLAGLAIFAGFAIAFLAPQVALAGYALASSDFRQAVAEHPQAALQVALALIAWAGLVGWPLTSRILRLARRRSVEICGTRIRVAESSLFGEAVWTAGLEDFSCAGFEVRSTVAGFRRDFVLRHSDRRRSLVLAAGEQIDHPGVRDAIDAVVRGQAFCPRQDVAPARSVIEAALGGPVPAVAAA